MLSVVALLSKALLRRKPQIFWVFIFPILLLLLFGYIYASGGSPKIPIYVYYGSSSKIGKELVAILNKTSTAFEIHVLNKSIEKPMKFVIDMTSKSKVPVLLVVVKPTEVNIYSTSKIWGSIVSGYVTQALYMIFNPRAYLPIKVNLNLPGSANKTGFLTMNTTRLTVLLMLVQALTEGFHTLTLVASLVVTGLNKRAALFRVTKYKLAIAVTLSIFIVALLASIMLLAVAYATLHVKLEDVLLDPYMWVSYVLTFMFGAGIALMLSRVILRGLDVAAASSLATALFLMLAFLSGYFVPIEVMPETLAKIALALPTTQLGVLAYTTAMGGAPNMNLLTYSAAVSLAIFAIGVITFTPYRRI